MTYVPPSARRIAALSALLSLSQIPPAEAQQPPPAPTFEQIYKMPAVYTVPNMEKVEIHRDIVYKTVNNVDLRMDVYIPPNPRPVQTFPVVLLISGGGIEAGKFDFRDAGIYVSYGKILAASGFIGVSFSKR